MLATLLLLLAPATAIGADDKFAVVAEKKIQEILWRSYGAFGALAPNGKSVLIVKDGQLTIRPVPSSFPKTVILTLKK